MCVLILTDPVNGAQQAGSWAVRETFVAVITSNMPMIFPLFLRWGRLAVSALRSFSSAAGKASGMSRSTDPKPGAFRLEDNSRRGAGPPNVHPIPDFTMNSSEEHIVDTRTQSRGSHAKTMTDGRGSDTDLEAGHHSGGILKQTLVHVTESRKSRNDLVGGGGVPDIGDYYLYQQSRRSADAERQNNGGGGSKKLKRLTVNFKS